MRFGQTIEGGPQPKPVDKEKTPINREFIESVREQTGIEEGIILAKMLEKASPEEQAALLQDLVELRQKELDAEIDSLVADIGSGSVAPETAPEGKEESLEIETDIQPENEVPERKKESWLKKSKVIKSFTGLCSALSVYAAFSHGPMEKKAYAGGPGFNIGDQINRSISGALDNVIREIGRGAGEGAKDLTKRMIGGGLTPQEKSRLIHEKIRLESTKAYEIQRMEIDEIREMRRFQRDMGRQAFGIKLEDFRMKQQERRALLADYRNMLRNAKSPDEIKMAEEKFKAGMKALEMIDKNIQPEGQTK